MSKWQHPSCYVVSESVLLENVEMSEETRVIVVSFSVANAAFSHDALRHFMLDLSFARGGAFRKSRSLWMDVAYPSGHNSC
jgi:hypothetical protein